MSHGAQSDFSLAGNGPAPLAPSHGSPASVHFSSKRENWETPPALFAKINAEYQFTVDVCASAENAKCARYYDRALDGLKQDWAGERAWMNPPYGRGIGKWMQKALNESRRGAVVMCLVPARTDTRWWHDYAMRGQVTFLRGRVRFVGARNGAPFPSALVLFKPENTRI
jgi:phage N-6-adenine-methyltransferase